MTSQPRPLPAAFGLMSDADRGVHASASLGQDFFDCIPRVNSRKRQRITSGVQFGGWYAGNNPIGVFTGTAQTKTLKDGTVYHGSGGPARLAQGPTGEGVFYGGYIVAYNAGAAATFTLAQTITFKAGVIYTLYVGDLTPAPTTTLPSFTCILSGGNRTVTYAVDTTKTAGQTIAVMKPDGSGTDTLDSGLFGGVSPAAGDLIYMMSNEPASDVLADDEHELVHARNLGALGKAGCWWPYTALSARSLCSIASGPAGNSNTRSYPAAALQRQMNHYVWPMWIQPAGTFCNGERIILRISGDLTYTSGNNKTIEILILPNFDPTKATDFWDPVAGAFASNTPGIWFQSPAIGTTGTRNWNVEIVGEANGMTGTSFIHNWTCKFFVSGTTPSLGGISAALIEATRCHSKQISLNKVNWAMEDVEMCVLIKYEDSSLIGTPGKHGWYAAQPMVLSVTGATWNESAKTLTKTNAFLGYSPSHTDVLNVTGGTGAVVAQYAINANAAWSANSITLMTSIGPGANGQTDIAADLYDGLGGVVYKQDGTAILRPVEFSVDYDASGNH